MQIDSSPKLIDSSPKFQNKFKPQAILTIGYGIEQNFWNQIWGLTFDIGKNNPGAIGLRYIYICPYDIT